MGVREYYKIMSTVFGYYGVLFSLSAACSWMLIHFLPMSPWSTAAFIMAVLCIWRVPASEKTAVNILMTSTLMVTFAWMITYVITFEYIKYVIPLSYAFSAFILFFVKVLADHYKIRFSCVASYAFAGACSFCIFPPLLMLTGHNLVQSIAIIVVTFYETAMLITHLNYLIIYKSYTDPHQVFLAVNGK